MRAAARPEPGGRRFATTRLRALVLAAVIAVAACSGSDDGRATGATGETLVLAQSFEPPATLDPALSPNAVTYNVVRPVLETLVGVEAGRTEVVPQLATSWKVSSDGRSWTLQLRENVRFHDGTAFDAAAVCANFERWYRFTGILQPLARTWGQFFGFAAPNDPSTQSQSLYRSCEAPADNEVVINLTRKTGALLPTLAVPAFSIASPTALRRYDADKVTGTSDQPIFQGSYGATQLIGTGPFQLERWDRNDKIVLLRNHTYWGSQPALDRVIVRRIDDGAARRQALESGEIHGYWPVKADDITPLRKAGFRVHELPNLTLGYLGFNQARPPLDNLRIRQAINHAIDRAKLVQAKYPASATVANQIVPPNLWGHADDVRVYPHDPERARQLIAESGVVRPTLELWYPIGMDDGTPPLPDPEGIALSFKADLEKAGFIVIAKPTPASPDYFEALSSGKVQLFLSEYFGSRLDPDALFDSFTLGYGTKALGPHDADIATVLQAAEHEVEQTDRARLYQQANRMVADRALLVPFVHVKPAIVHAPKVTDYKPSSILWEGLVDVRLS